MKYEEILPAVTEGEWFRLNQDLMWVRMGEDGSLYDTTGNLTHPYERYDYTKATWEVKPKKIVLWCVSHKNTHTGYNNHIGIDLCNAGVSEHTIISSTLKPLFPVDSPIKYKLTPLED